jgi:hypothetical protein
MNFLKMCRHGIRLLLITLLGLTGSALAEALPANPALPSPTCVQEGKPVNKQCDCVRKSGSGFPYVETRKMQCKTYKDAAGKTCRVECSNCYSVCLDSPAG